MQLTRRRQRLPPIDAPVHRSAPSAWAYLVEHGGLELSDRDDGLADDLVAELDPRAASLQVALHGASVDAL